VSVVTSNAYDQLHERLEVALRERDEGRVQLCESREIETKMTAELDRVICERNKASASLSEATASLVALTDAAKRGAELLAKAHAQIHELLAVAQKASDGFEKMHAIAEGYKAERDKLHAELMALRARLN
jgi:hypothetical protein